MKMKNNTKNLRTIQALADNGEGVLSQTQIVIERSGNGWSVADGPEITHDHPEEIRGWGRLDGPAFRQKNGLLIPARGLA